MPPTSWQDEVLYFAYGVNLCRAHMDLWCPDSHPLSRAVLPDHRLVFRTWADVAASPGDTVPGAVYEITPKDLASLDEFQDCPALYHHVHVRVETGGGPVEALAYQMNPGHPLALPDADYLSLLLRGYEDWGLDFGALEQIDRGARSVLDL
jgi:gamma-glutamylcyclotransferase (GGCT)/AIG2-like uncharacterized protein YtfP